METIETCKTKTEFLADLSEIHKKEMKELDEKHKLKNEQLNQMLSLIPQNAIEMPEPMFRCSVCAKKCVRQIWEISSDDARNKAPAFITADGTKMSKYLLAPEYPITERNKTYVFCGECDRVMSQLIINPNVRGDSLWDEFAHRFTHDHIRAWGKTALVMVVDLNSYEKTWGLTHIADRRAYNKKQRDKKKRVSQEAEQREKKEEQRERCIAMNNDPNYLLWKAEAERSLCEGEEAKAIDALDEQILELERQKRELDIKRAENIRKGGLVFRTLYGVE